MIPADSMPSFVTDVAQAITTAPFKGVVPKGREPIFDQDFLVGRIEGFLTKISLHGRFRRAENAWAEHLNYPLRRLPYVPLVGLVVRANPRAMLEVYETRLAFKAAAGARAWLDSVRHDSSGARPIRDPDRIGDHVWAFRSAFGRSSNDERVITVLFQTGTVGTEINVQGGIHVANQSALDLARDAYSRLVAVC